MNAYFKVFGLPASFLGKAMEPTRIGTFLPSILRVLTAFLGTTFLAGFLAATFLALFLTTFFATLAFLTAAFLTTFLAFLGATLGFLAPY